jgi:acyl-CoA thioester hydrolase
MGADIFLILRWMNIAISSPKKEPSCKITRTAFTLILVRSFAFYMAKTSIMPRPEFKRDLFPHWHEVPVRFRDLDPLNHANNAVFNTYFEEARIHFTYSIPELRNAYEEGYSFVLVRSTIEYLKPVTYPAQLVVGSGVQKLGNTSVEAYQALFNKKTEQLHGIAVTKGVWFNTKTQRPSRVPEMDTLEKFMVRFPTDG